MLKKIGKRLIFAFLPIAVIITGCTTLYQKEGVFTNGYSDFRSASDTFVVTFRANEETPPEKVLEYALMRSSEIALKNGFSYFSVIETISSSPTVHYPSLRLTIQCFDSPPSDREWINAKEFQDLHFR